MNALLSVLLACAQPLRIATVDSVAGPPGTAITVSRANLVEGTTVGLDGGTGRWDWVSRNSLT